MWLTIVGLLEGVVPKAGGLVSPTHTGQEECWHGRFKRKWHLELRVPCKCIMRDFSLLTDDHFKYDHPLGMVVAGLHLHAQQEVLQQPIQWPFLE